MSEEKTVSVAYRPGVGDPESTTAYGRTFEAGEFVDLPIEFAERARNNPSFEVQGEKTFGDKDDNEKPLANPFDDPDYPRDANTEPDISFDEAVELERTKEYGTPDPALADRLRVAREHNRDLAGVSRLEAEAAIAANNKRKPGRPKKDKGESKLDAVQDDEARARAEDAERDRAAREAAAEREREEQADRDRRAAEARDNRDQSRTVPPQVTP